MEHLPLLVVHGAWLWMPVAPLVVAGLYLLWSVRRRVASRRRANAARIALGAVSPDLAGVVDGVTVVIEGTLVCAGRCDSYVDGFSVAAASFSWGKEWLTGASTLGTLGRRAESLAVQTADGDVELLGQVQVLAGSAGHVPGGRAGAADCLQRLCLDAEVETPSPRWLERPSHHWLQSGDRVVVKGAVTRVPGRAVDYRDNATAIRLEPAVAAGTLQVAFTGDPELYRADLRSRLWAVFGSALFFLASSSLLGHCAMKAEGELVARDQPFSLSELSWTSVAAATPFHRDEALADFYYSVGNRGTAEQDRLDASVAIAGLRGRCHDQVSRYLEHAQYRKTIEQSKRCTARLLTAEVAAHAALAEFEEASALLERFAHLEFQDLATRRVVSIHVLARRWDRAAASAAQFADRIRVASPASGGVWDCLALAMSVRAGNVGESLASMRGRKEHGARQACALLLAELTGQLGQVASDSNWSTEADELQLVRHKLERARAYLLLQKQQLKDDRYVHRAYWSTRGIDSLMPGRWDVMVDLGLTHRLVTLAARSAHEQRAVVDATGALALHAVRVGLYDRVPRLLATLRREEAIPLGGLEAAREIELALALRRGDVQSAVAIAEQDEHVKLYDVDHTIGLFQGDAEAAFAEQKRFSHIHRSLIEGLRRALETHDGEHLRGRLDDWSSIEWNLLSPMVRHVTTHRESIREFARLARAPSNLRYRTTPWLSSAAARLMLAEGIGDTALAAEYRQQVARHYEAMTDPGSALFLFLVSD